MYTAIELCQSVSSGWFHLLHAPCGTQVSKHILQIANSVQVAEVWKNLWIDGARPEYKLLLASYLTSNKTVTFICTLLPKYHWRSVLQTWFHHWLDHYYSYATSRRTLLENHCSTNLRRKPRISAGTVGIRPGGPSTTTTSSVVHEGHATIRIFKESGIAQNNREFNSCVWRTAYT